MENSTVRPVHEIAADIRKDWKNVNFAARPYLNAMAHLTTVDDNYGADSGKDVVIYFLSNATTWKGEHARAIKKELKSMYGIK